MAENVQKGLARRLQDLEYRREYGAAHIKSGLALVLREAREDQGLSQKDLADQAGVSQPYIAKLESGDANPTIGHIGSIFAVMWLTLDFNVSLLSAMPVWNTTPPSVKPEPSAYEDTVLDTIKPGSVDTSHLAYITPRQTGTATGGL